jgi:cytidylate kinase
MYNKKIIGLSGTNGSGKDTVGKILADKYGYLFISVTDLLRTEAARRGQPVEREVLRTISAEWRRELGLGVLVDKAVAEYELVKDKYTGVTMASLRNPGEADRVHEFGGAVVWIDAEPQTRYSRIQANAATRGRAEEDNKTFEQFLVEEQAEMHSSGDEATLDMAGVKTKADVFINNNGDNLVVLQKDIEQALGLNP